MPAWRCLLPGGRWHFQHGPMDLIIEARGDSRAVALAHERAWLRFAGLLQELVDELPALRAPVGAGCALRGVVARRMWAACRPYRAGFITPMAAVAGAVAQEILAGYARDGIARAWVNNGGDIALHLAPGESASVGICSDIAALDAAQLRNGLLPDGQLRISSAMPVRGVATSGWRGRSQSLGIADSVTVLARTAAEADAAATIVANAVDVPDERIGRMPAWQVRADSDLGALPVTVAVPTLPAGQVRHALRQGLEKAQRLQSGGLLWWALLVCQRQWVATAAPSMAAQPFAAAAPFVAVPPPSIAAAPARSLHHPLHRSLP
ncbi:UPF0280 family protein [Verminephrobacter eiseniae]|uniref:UPF0280 family protein n=1 Tax=Verminephrobacter eiseniae TaxID=364317 RepID=UPI002238B1B0|nr:UPF0280 family protein [Verminephrobacter eiseniae]MCW5235744.1 UPF0280 family protein [Verminephrobacter eiseniae]